MRKHFTTKYNNKRKHFTTKYNNKRNERISK